MPNYIVTLQSNGFEALRDRPLNRKKALENFTLNEDLYFIEAKSKAKAEKQAGKLYDSYQLTDQTLTSTPNNGGTLTIENRIQDRQEEKTETLLTSTTTLLPVFEPLIEEPIVDESLYGRTN